MSMNALCLLLFKCDAGIGTNALYRQLYQPPAKLLVLGAGCSEVSQATAQVSHLWNLLQVNVATSMKLQIPTEHKRPRRSLFW